MEAQDTYVPCVEEGAQHCTAIGSPSFRCALRFLGLSFAGVPGTINQSQSLEGMWAHCIHLSASFSQVICISIGQSLEVCCISMHCRIKRQFAFILAVLAFSSTRISFAKVFSHFPINGPLKVILKILKAEVSWCFFPLYFRYFG